MYLIDRTMIVIRPLKPFLKWLKSIDASSDDLTLEQLRSDDCNSYMIPQMKDRTEVDHYLEGAFTDVFQVELSSWTTDPTEWPLDVDFEMFLKWFEVDVHSMVLDMVLEPVERDSFFDEEPPTEETAPTNH